MNAKTTTQASLGDIFVIKKANEWSKSAALKPVPRMLFGEFWMESELAILFANGGKGKSVLAMQIAESIARGCPVGPIKLTAKAQKVLYLDLILTEKQFEMRYARVTGGDNNRKFKGVYKFSENLERVEMAPGSRDSILSGQAFAAWIEPLVEFSGAKVLIIDNITHLRRANQSSRDELPLMRELDRLKRKYGLSILVLASSYHRDAGRPLAIGDLRASRILGNFADSIFAIGEGRRTDDRRYLKHIWSRNNIPVCDETRVPIFTVNKLGGNFLGCKFIGFGTEEQELREPVITNGDMALIGEIKRMCDDGMSYREIAAELSISKTKAHRLRQLWHPPQVRPVAKEQVNQFYFPGREEYEAAKEDPKFNGMHDREDPEAYALRGEWYLIEVATVAARKEYLKTGEAPLFAETFARVALESKARETALADRSAEPGGGEDVADDTVNIGSLKGLRRELDSNGREIFVESTHDNGKPRIYYKYDSKGRLSGWENKGYGNIGFDPEERGQEAI